MMIESGNASKEDLARDDRDVEGIPEATSLLNSENAPEVQGVANTEPAAESSSPLLVRPDQRVDSVERDKKPKRKKSKKPGKSLSSDGTRSKRSKTRSRDIVKSRAALSGNQGGDRDQENRPRTETQDQRVVHRSARCVSVWGCLNRFVCVKGSLRLTPSLSDLPQLTSEAQGLVKSLDKITRNSPVEISVRHTDDMPFSSNNITSYSHPIVVLHIVDACTGLPLSVHQHTGPAKFSTRMANAFEWNTSHVWRDVTLGDVLSPQTIILVEIVEPRHRKKQSTSSSSTASSLDHDLSSEAFYKRIAWCFLKPISDNGNIRLPTLSLPDKATSHEATLRLQLFSWTPISWLDAQQARYQFQWDPESGVGVPSVFVQYQRRRRMQLPSTLHVEIRPIASLKSPKRLEGVPENLSESVPTNDVTPPSDHDGSAIQTSAQPKQEQAETSASVPDPLLSCKRHIGEPCLVPQRVLHRLPTGRKGCSRLIFSPDGLFIAAAVHHLTSTTDEWVIHIYELNSGALWQSCRGHQSMIYSLEWGVLADGNVKALVSASSDGSAILWRLCETANSSGSSSSSAILPSQTFQHVPAPVFVYCALFHCTQPRLIVTGASDGVVRLWRTQQADTETNGKAVRAYESTPVYEWKVTASSHAVSIHCIRMEPKQAGRLFCGDSSGSITVWTPVPSASGALSYELSKTVRTGQRSIVSLSLHPRKQHLLALAHPHGLFQYETRSFLLLHKNYSGVECDQLLVRASFSPDGQYVVSGSEDGIPHLFGAVEGARLDGLSGGLWGHRFFHGFPLMEIAWSPTAHVVAIGAYGEHHPIVVLSASHADRTRLGTSSDSLAKNVPDQLSPGSNQLYQVDRHAQAGEAVPKSRRDPRIPVAPVDEVTCD